jgi:hypothetical protein
VRALETRAWPLPAEQAGHPGHPARAAEATPPLGLPELTVRSRPDVVAAELNMIQTFATPASRRWRPWPQLDCDPDTRPPELDHQHDIRPVRASMTLALSLGASLAQVDLRWRRHRRPCEVG